MPSTVPRRVSVFAERPCDSFEIPKSTIFARVGAVVARAEENVVGLEVAVDDPGGVRAHESAQDLSRDVNGFPNRQHAVALEPAPEVLAGEQLHHEKGQSLLGGTGIEDVHDVLALDDARRLGLALKALGRAPVASGLAGQKLQRDTLADRRIRRREDRSHAAPAEHAVDPILCRPPRCRPARRCRRYSERGPASPS